MGGIRQSEHPRYSFKNPSQQPPVVVFGSRYPLIMLGPTPTHPGATPAYPLLVDYLPGWHLAPPTIQVFFLVIIPTK